MLSYSDQTCHVTVGHDLHDLWQLDHGGAGHNGCPQTPGQQHFEAWCVRHWPLDEEGLEALLIDQLKAGHQPTKVFRYHRWQHDFKNSLFCLSQVLQSDVRQRPRGFKGQESVDVEVKTVEGGDQRSCLSINKRWVVTEAAALARNWKKTFEKRAPKFKHAYRGFGQKRST